MNIILPLSLIFLGLSTSITVASTLSDPLTLIRQPPAIYCGNSLNRMMKVICGRNFRNFLLQKSQGYTKRSTNAFNQLWNQYDDDEYLPSDNRFSGNDLEVYDNFFYPKRSVTKEGVVQTCCRNPCDVLTLLEFCPA